MPATKPTTILAADPPLFASAVKQILLNNRLLHRL